MMGRSAPPTYVRVTVLDRLVLHLGEKIDEERTPVRLLLPALHLPLLAFL